MTEGEVATHGNIEIARLTIDWPVPCVKPRLLCLEIHPPMGKRRREIAHDNGLRVRRNDSSAILVVVRLVYGLDERPEVGFSFRSQVFQYCV
jgi:hypothetical protein